MGAGDAAEADDQSILCWGDYRQGVLGNDSNPGPSRRLRLRSREATRADALEARL